MSIKSNILKKTLNKCLRERITALRGTRNLAVYSILSRLLRSVRLVLHLAHSLIPYFLNLSLAALLACCITACNQSKSKNAAGSLNYPIIDWSMLTPPKWDAMETLKGTDLSKLQDADPKAVELLKNVREQWNNAPVVKNWDGHSLSIKGYIAPLDGDATHIKEFLLVPYFGACIHSPPPPSNQIIHVRMKGQAIPFTHWDSVVTVSGVLQVKASSTGLGNAGYQMQAESLEAAK